MMAAAGMLFRHGWTGHAQDDWALHTGSPPRVVDFELGAQGPKGFTDR